MFATSSTTVRPQSGTEFSTGRRRIADHPEAQWRPKSSLRLFWSTGDWGGQAITSRRTMSGCRCGASEVARASAYPRGGGGIADTPPDGVVRQLRHKGTCPVRIPRTEAGNGLAQGVATAAAPDHQPANPLVRQ